jgi:RimJ/RimL family protein N-acetyltransferase
VFSDFRGKTYGTQGVSAVLSIAEQKGYSVATARVRKTNVPSRRLCESVGFRVVGSDVTAKGHPVDCVRIALK